MQEGAEQAALSLETLMPAATGAGSPPLASVEGAGGQLLNGQLHVVLGRTPIRIIPVRKKEGMRAGGRIFCRS